MSKCKIVFEDKPMLCYNRLAVNKRCLLSYIIANNMKGSRCEKPCVPI